MRPVSKTPSNKNAKNARAKGLREERKKAEGFAFRTRSDFGDAKSPKPDVTLYETSKLPTDRITATPRCPERTLSLL
jgi:hypothetical protein